VTRFTIRETAPATSNGGGAVSFTPSTSVFRPAEKAVELPKSRLVNWQEVTADVPLACGCMIPWPIIVEFGRNVHGQVLCSEHGYQPRITKAQVEKSRKEARTCQAKLNLNQSTLPDKPPF
jgi:hypothetical protein